MDSVVERAHDVVTEGSREERAAHAWLAIGIIGLVGFVLMTAALLVHVVFAFDRQLLDTAITWTGWALVWNIFSELGDYPMVPTGFGLVVWLIFKKRRREAVLCILLFAAATAGSEGVKALVARDRPLGSAPGIPGSVYSYPSGHALEGVMILGMVALNLWRHNSAMWLKWGFTILAIAFVAMVCVARVALDLHYPTDIIGGLFGGFAVLGLYGWWTRPGAWADHPPRAPSPS
jgi:undecaprenyl-diphosphatase